MASKKVTLLDVVTVVLLILTFSNFNELGLIMAILFSVAVFLRAKSFHVVVPKSYWLLIVLSVFTFFTLMLNGSHAYFGQNVRRTAASILIYYAGFLLVRKSENHEKAFRTFWMIAVVAMGLYGIGNWLMSRVMKVDYSEFSALYQIYMARNTYDIWTRAPIYPTVEAMYLIPTTALLVYFIRFERSWRRAALLILWLMAFLAASYISSRSALVIWLVVTLSSLFFFMRERVSRAALQRVFLGVVVVVGLLFVFHDQILNAITNSNLYNRILSLGSGEMFSGGERSEIYKYVLSNAIAYPFGNMPGYVDGASAHNVLLDVIKSAGLIPFALMLAFMVMMIGRAVHINRAAKLEKKTRYLCAYSMMMFMLLMLVESPFSSNNLFMTMFYYFCGMAEGLYLSQMFANGRKEFL